MVPSARPAATRIAARLLLLALCGLSGCALSPDGTRSYDTITVGDRTAGSGPHVLCVQAHPDDETVFAGTLYKTRTLLDGRCDILLITNGEGGFKYSSLAEPIYDLPLTDEPVGRRNLPAIREKEFLSGCRWLGIRKVYLFRETDNRYSTDPLEVLGPQASVWNLERIRQGLRGLLAREHYDFILTQLPEPTTHGHHQAAAILVLEAVQRLPVDGRPIILGARAEQADDLKPPSAGLPGFPATKLDPAQEAFIFDRRQPLGYQGKLNYQIVVNWVIAEHKSQGMMQLFTNLENLERFWLFELNGAEARARTEEWFADLKKPQYPGRTYGPSAGAPRPAP